MKNGSLQTTPTYFHLDIPPDHCGIGNTVYDLIKENNSKREIRVLTNLTNYGESEFPYVFYAWKKGDKTYPFRISRAIDELKINKAIIHVEHHFYLYGGLTQNLEFPILLLLLKMRGHRIVTQLHSVINLNENNPISELPKLPIIDSLLNRSIKSFYFLCAYLSHYIIVNTQSMKKTLINTYNISPQKIVEVPLGWDTHRTKIDEKSVSPKSELKIVFHGFIDPSKGLENLLKAFKKIIEKKLNVKLIIAGEASPNLRNSQIYFNSLKKLSNDLDLADSVTFTGHIDESKIEDVLKSADIFVEPYTMKYSSGGSAVLTRIAGYGKPIIASRISKFSDELVDDRTALLFDVNDVEELANAMIRLVNDQALRKRLGNELLIHASGHTWAKSYQLLEEKVYSKLEENNY